MQVNLNRPYQTTMSAPQECVFYSKKHTELMFAKDEEIEIYCGSLKKGTYLKWELSRNMLETPFETGMGEALPSYTWIIKPQTKNLYPGFYDIKVTGEVGDGTFFTSICTFGYDVENMKVNYKKPDDFTQLWEKSKQKLSGIELDAKEWDFQVFDKTQINSYNVVYAGMASDYDKEGHEYEEVECCQVSFASVDGKRIYGRLAKPKAEGKFPVMIIFPGAGFISRPIPLEHARHGYIAIDVQIHGQEADLPEYAPVDGWEEQMSFENPEKHYYNNIYLHCLQTINYMLSRDDADKDKLVLAGGSQGGRLSLITASMDERVKAVVAGIAHNANLPYLQWAEKMNSKLSDGMDCELCEEMTQDMYNKAYYDTMSFAENITCPVLMNAGLIDKVSPPTGVWAIFNKIPSAKKEIIPISGIAHDWSPEFDRCAWKWLKDIL